MGDGVLGGLIRTRHRSQSKSYFIGLERGRTWAFEEADYITKKEWGELTDLPSNTVLPDDEETHFHRIGIETPLEWEDYIKGWLDGVKEANRS